MATKPKIPPSLVDQFVNVTGASKAIAKSLSEACNGNLEMATSSHAEAANGSNAAGFASWYFRIQFYFVLMSQ